MVAIDSKTDSEYNIIELKTKWFDRALFGTESNFGAVSKDMDGYCTWKKSDRGLPKKKSIF